MKLDKIDIADAIADHLDGVCVEGIGSIVQATGDDDGVVLLEIRSTGGEDVDFKLKVTKARGTANDKTR